LFINRINFSLRHAIDSQLQGRSSPSKQYVGEVREEEGPNLSGVIIITNEKNYTYPPSLPL